PLLREWSSTFEMAATSSDMTATFYDSYWKVAAEAALAALGEADYVLTPAEFLPLDARFAPLEYSWGLKGLGLRLAFCCPKHDVDRLAPWLANRRTSCYRWSNEVFVLGANFDWSQRADANSQSHLVAWFEQLE